GLIAAARADMGEDERDAQLRLMVEALAAHERVELREPENVARLTRRAIELNPALAPLYNSEDLALAEALGGRDRLARFRELAREYPDLRLDRSADRA